MTAPSFLRGVVVAVALSIAAAVAVPVFAPVTGLHDAFRLTVALVAAGYLVSLLRGGAGTAGVPTAAAIWLILAAILALLVQDVPAYVAAHTGLIWIVRSLLIHRSAGFAITDALLSGMALVAGALALSRTGSTFLAVWTFFFAQAAVAALSAGRRTDANKDVPDPQAAFVQAEQQAERALERLISRSPGHL